jgi:hypothetical protein
MRFFLIAAFVATVLPAQDFVGHIKLRPIVPPLNQSLKLHPLVVHQAPVLNLNQPWKKPRATKLFFFMGPGGTNPCITPKRGDRSNSAAADPTTPCVKPVHR